MALIILNTEINASLELCFNLSTSIDLHKESAIRTKEKVIAGRKSGLIKLNESVTWKAKHFGLWHTLTVKITKYKKPTMFTDEMIQGGFKYMKHKHEFNKVKNGTMMVDTFEFQSPMGMLGKIVDALVLKSYLTKFLNERNRVLKLYAETDKWKLVLEVNNNKNTNNT